MRRVHVLMVLAALGCAGPEGAHSYPLRFSRNWVSGDVEVRRDGKRIAAAITLRLRDERAFAADFPRGPMDSFPCQTVRLLYRSSPRSASRFLQTKWADAPILYSDQPEVCLHAGVEWKWRVLIAPERGLLPLADDGRLVVISGGQDSSTGQIAVVLLRRPESPEDWNNLADADRFIVARSQWLPLSGAD